MKICITGSTGLVGSEAVKYFQEKGWDVIGIDNNARAENLGTPNKSPEYNIDIRDSEAIAELFETHKFDAILHAAGQASHDWSKDHPITDFTTNVWGTINLLEATRQLCPKATFVYISSDKVYGENAPNRSEWTEKINLDQTNRTPFGAGKLSADLYVQEYGRCYGMNTVCFRCGCITGKNHEGAELHGFLAYMTKCIKEGKTYKIFGFNGEQVRDQIHAWDLAGACYEFIKSPKIGAVYNMGGGPERAKTLIEFSRLLSDKIGLPFSAEFIDEPRWADRKYDVHDVGKFKGHYPDWKYEYDLGKIISDLCDTN
uniref:Putative NADH dehydrogenase n=1 Tax=viral metagenome TaxID=1070528 RepID=A0A6M3J5V4_9ZZZZ